MSRRRSRYDTTALLPPAMTPAIGFSLGRRALIVGGTVQSVDPDDAKTGYWSAMLPATAPRSALLLGLGGGTVAHLLTRRFGPVAITGVDESVEIIELAMSAFGLALPNMTVVSDDAAHYVRDTAEQFDFIAVDLYRGNRIARGMLALPFLHALVARLRPGGSVACNLFRDELLPGRLARLARVFEQVRLAEVGANAVFHGRPRWRYRH